MTSALPNAAPTTKNVSRKQDRAIDTGDVLAFLIPFLQFVQLKLVGVLSGSDAFCLVLFIYFVLRGQMRIEPRNGKWLIGLCSLWLLSQCVTDMVRHSAFADYARGWSNIGVTIAVFAVLFTLLYGRSRRLILYGWGLSLGSLLTYFISPDEFMKDEPWKFGLGFPVTLAMLLLAASKGCRGRWPIILCVFVGLLNMALGTRAYGGFCLAAALYMMLMRWIQRKSVEGSKVNAGMLVAIAASLVIGGVGILWFYQYAARTGMLGETAQEKLESQSSGKYGFLLGGRTEMFSYLPAIYDSPILGHGSWAKDPIYGFIQQRTLAELGYDFAGQVSQDFFSEGLIPTHSYIFGAWVDAGILGAVFWVFVFVITARALLRVYPSNFTLLPLMAYAGFGLLWDLVFSPYGAEARIISPYYVVLLMSCFNLAPQRIGRITSDLRRDKPQIAHIANPRTAS